MDVLTYRQSLWTMTDDQIKKQYNEKKNWKNADDLDLFREAESEHMKRESIRENNKKRATEQERVGVLAGEYSKVLKSWLDKGMVKTDGAYYYKDKIMFWHISSKHIDDLIIQVREIDEKFNAILQEEK